MIDNIFDAFSTMSLNAENKLINTKMLLDLILEKFTADDGKIYATTYENSHDLTEEEVAAMDLYKIEDIVEEEAMEFDDLFLSLLLFKDFIKNYGAKDVSFIHKDGVATFKVTYGDKSFEKTFNVELD